MSSTEIDIERVRGLAGEVLNPALNVIHHRITYELAEATLLMIAALESQLEWKLRAAPVRLEVCKTCGGTGSYEAQLPKPIVRICAQCHGVGKVMKPKESS